MAFTLSPYALTTLEHAKQQIGIPDADTNYDDILTRFINSCSNIIENYCDRKILARDYTDYFSGNNQRNFMLSQWPIQTIDEVWIDQNSMFDDSNDQLDSTEYAIDQLSDDSIGIILLGGQVFPVGIRNIKVVYNAGYSSVPAEIEEACLWWVDNLYTMRDNRSINTKSKGKNNENTTYRDDLPDVVKNMIAPYVRCEFPNLAIPSRHG